MRRVLVAAFVVYALGAAAEDRARPDPHVEAIVPVPPHEHERLRYFGRRDHHLVPGTVTIDRAPYVCDVDKETFHDRDAFTAHLRTSHNVAPAKILDSLIIRDGQVHFGGR